MFAFLLYQTTILDGRRVKDSRYESLEKPAVCVFPQVEGCLVRLSRVLSF